MLTGLLLLLVSPSAAFAQAQSRELAEGFFASLMAGGRTTNGFNVHDDIELTGGASVGVFAPSVFVELRYTGYRIDRSDWFHGVSVGVFVLSGDSARTSAAYFGASLGSISDQPILGLHVGGLGRVGDGWGLRLEAAGKFNPLVVFAQVEGGFWVSL